MQSGELIVTGKDKVEIPLRKFPSHVTVEFKDNCLIIPCNPLHHEELTFEIVKHHHHHHHTLVISWSVSNVREIVWNAYF